MDPSPVDRGGSKSCGPNLMVEGCTRTNQTFWAEDQFTVTVSSGIRDRDTRVAEIVSRDLQKAKPGKWGYVQARELCSSKEETHVRPDRVLWKATLDLEYHTIEKMGC